MYSVGTSLITGIWATLALVWSVTLPESFLYLLDDLTISKCKLSIPRFSESLKLVIDVDAVFSIHQLYVCCVSTYVVSKPRFGLTC